jgi:UDP-N-acetylmuramate--alanine ligase
MTTPGANRATLPAVLPPAPATVHMVGIGGIGVSGLARILAARGYTVTGSDLHDSPTLDDLRRDAITVWIGHSAEQVGDAALVVATAAAPPQNSELVEARRRGIPIIKRAALLGELSAMGRCLAVAGSHGKSTTSGMLAYVLDRAGLDPSFAVGAVVNQLGVNARPGAGDLFVVEADEYDYSFLQLSPDIAIVTNIEHDHPDLFPDLAAVERAFASFASRARSGGCLILSADDPACIRLGAAQAEAGTRVVTVGRDPRAGWHLRDDAGEPTVVRPDGTRIDLALSVAGAHNRMNAAMVLAALDEIGVNSVVSLEALREFTGVGRRFELRGTPGGVTVIDDYAHHPTEIAATIAAARERYPDARVWAVFQPHTYSRTRELLCQFARALDLADRVVLVEIYPARETDTLGVSSGSIAEQMTSPAPVVSTPLDAAREVAAEGRSGDVVLVLGAGDVWMASPVLIDELNMKLETDVRNDSRG